MDWDLKTPSWDETTLPNIETMEESNRFGVYRMKGDFSVDLKLGHNTHVTNSYSVSESPSLPVSKHAASSSASVSKIALPSSKKARAINNITMKVSCLVDGCNSDLSNCRDYHRRHKVCELHSKTPEVTISGLKQRFCQQCSRFHSLEQFDERKRSCRKRLDGHNRRRRKPQAEPLMRPAASFLSSYQGTQLLPFSSSTAIVNPAWNGGVVTSCAGGRLQIHNQQQHRQQVHVIDKQDIFIGSTATSYGGEGKQLAFLQGDNPSTATLNNQTPHLPITSSVCQTLLRTSSLSENCGVRNKMLTSSNSVQESPCALSLLSSSQTHTSGNGLNQMVQQPHSLSTLMQPLGLSLHGNSFESMVPNGTVSDHCSSLYNIGSEGSQGNEAPQLFPYHHWE